MNDNLFQNIYAAPNSQERELDPTFVETLGAAFGLENDVANLYDWVSRPSYKPDPTFDYRKPFTEMKLPEEWRTNLAGATSLGDFQDKVRRSQEEDKQRAALAAAGWTGTAAAMGAGILSPTTFLPFVGQGRRGLAMAEIVGLAAAGASAQEAALFYSQETRTEAETYANIATGTLLGGLMGGAWLGLTKSGRARMVRDFEDAQRHVELPVPGDGGSRKTKLRVEPTPQEYVDRYLFSPDLEGRDMSAGTGAKVETPVAEGFSRYYIIREDADSFRFTKDRELAIVDGQPLRHIDLPADDMRLRDAGDGSFIGFKTLRLGDEARTDTPFQLTPEMRTDTPLQLTPEMRSDGVLTLTDDMRTDTTLRLTETMRTDTPLRLSPEMRRIDDLESKVREAKEVYKGTDPKSPKAEELREAVDDLEPRETSFDRRDTQGIGAQTTRRVRNTQGVMTAPSRWRQAALNALGKASPHFRMAMSRQHPSLRDAAYRLADTGLRQAGLENAQPSARGGTVTDRIRHFDQYLAEYLTTFDSVYYKYLYGAEAPDPSQARAAVAQVRASIGMQPPGKLNPAEFHEAIYDALSTGATEIPEAKKMAEALRKFFANYNNAHKAYLEELRQVDPGVKPLYKELTEDEFGEGVRDYAHQIYSKEQIVENSEEFLTDFSNFYDEGLRASFAKDFARYMKKKKELAFKQLIQGMSPEKRGEWFAAQTDEISMMDELPELAERALRRKDLRQQARDEGWEPKQLRSHLKDLDDNLTPAAKTLLTMQGDLKRMVREAKKLGANDTIQLDKAQAAFDSADAKLESMFQHTIPEIERIDLSIGKIQSASDAAFKAAKKKVKVALEALEKREAQYEKLLGSKRNNTTTRAKVLELVGARRMAYRDALDRLDSLEGQGVDMVNVLRELNTSRQLAVRGAVDLAAKRGAAREEAAGAIADLTPNTTRIETGVEVTVGDATYTNPLVVKDMDALRNKMYPKNEGVVDVSLISERSLFDEMANLGHDGIYMSRGEGLPPEWIDLRAQARELTQERMDDAFRAKWDRRGARGSDPTLGNPSFKDASMEMAVYWMQKLLKADVQPAYFLAKQDVRGPQLMRMQHIPYDIKRKYLNRNTEVVATAYDRQMAPDLELWRAFDGHVNGSNVLAQMEQEKHELILTLQDSKFVKLPKGRADKSAKLIDRVKKRLSDVGDQEEAFVDPSYFSTEAKEGYVPLTRELRTQIINTINAETQAQARNFDIAIQRLRHTRMVPENADSLLYRTARTIKDANTPLMMGTVLVSSIPDIARPIYQYGINKLARQSWNSYISNLTSAKGKKFRVQAKEVNRQLGLTLETILHGRASAIHEMLDPQHSRKTLVEKGAKFLAHKTGIVGFFSFWTQMNKAVAGAATQATLLTYTQAIGETLRSGGKMVGEQQAMLEWLRARGLQDVDILRIHQQLQRPGAMEEFANGAKLPNLEDWEDLEAFRLYGAAVRNETDRLIITPGLEQPNIVDENLAMSMVFQFKSFGFAANSRIMMSNLQGNDPYLAQGTLASLAMGALSYYTWAIAAGGSALDKANEGNVEDWIYESVDRSGLLAMLSIGQRIGEQIPLLNQFAIFGGEDKPFRRPQGFLGTLLGPSMGQAEKMTEFLKNLGAEEDSLKRRNLRLLRQMFIPYQNLFYTRQALDKVGDQINSALGIAE